MPTPLHSNNSSATCSRINCLSVCDHFVGLAYKGLKGTNGKKGCLTLMKSCTKKIHKTDWKTFSLESIFGSSCIFTKKPLCILSRFVKFFRAVILENTFDWLLLDSIEKLIFSRVSGWVSRTISLLQLNQNYLRATFCMLFSSITSCQIFCSCLVSKFFWNKYIQRFWNYSIPEAYSEPPSRRLPT